MNNITSAAIVIIRAAMMLYSGSGVLLDTEVVTAEAIKIPASSKVWPGLELMSKFEPIPIEKPYAGLPAYEIPTY